MIWSQDDPSRLSATVATAIKDRRNVLVVGIETAWEIGIRNSGDAAGVDSSAGAGRRGYCRNRTLLVGRTSQSVLTLGRTGKSVLPEESVPERHNAAEQLATWGRHRRRPHRPVLWRITDGHNLDNLTPKAAVIMIGANNTGGHRAPQTAGGIRAIVEELKRQKPDIKVLVLGVFPRGNAGVAERSVERSPKASSRSTRS